MNISYTKQHERCRKNINVILMFFLWHLSNKIINYTRGEIMNNKTLVVIDAGHGGIDSGAVGNGIEEKDLNLKAAKHIYERLQELNIPVVITRTEDEYLPKDKRIERIKTLTNNNPNTLLISNHINAGGGEFTYHC